jgi:hypothetical protein
MISPNVSVKFKLEFVEGLWKKAKVSEYRDKINIEFTLMLLNQLS